MDVTFRLLFHAARLGLQCDINAVLAQNLHHGFRGIGGRVGQNLPAKAAPRASSPDDELAPGLHNVPLTARRQRDLT